MSNSMCEMDELLSKEQYAIKYRVSVPCVNVWAAEGRIKKVKIGGRAYFQDTPPAPKVSTKTNSHE